MIVKNEEFGLKRAVDSARDIVDEVMIGVDTASYDGTLKVAKEVADICYEYDWNDSFCDARNTYLGRSDADWIIALDGHEYIAKYQDIDWEDASKKADAIRIQIQMEDNSIIRADRIYKNGIKYLSNVHNYPDVERVIKDEEFLIIHDRQVQEDKALDIRWKQRDNMILNIWELEIRQELFIMQEGSISI